MADASLGTAVLKTKLDTSGLKMGFDAAKRETQKFAADSSTAIRGIGAAFGAIAASQGARSYISFMRSAASEAHQATTATALYEKALQRNNQSLAEGRALVGRLADQFGVVNSVVEESATFLLRKGASLDVVEKALMTAGASAAAAGFDISTAFNNVSTAVATGNSALLKTSGIVTTLGAAEAAYAKSIGKTVEALTQQERIGARVNAIYAETASEIEDVDILLKGLPKSQAEVTKEWTAFRQTAGDLALKVIVPLNEALSASLRFVNELPTPIKNGGIAMAGAAIGATALATGFTAIRTALTGLSALGLLSFGPTGWIVLGATVVTGLAVALSGMGNPNSLEGAADRASKAVAGGDKSSLLGAMKDLKGYIDGELTASLDALTDLLENVQMSAVGTVVLMQVSGAVTDAMAQIAELDNEIRRLSTAPSEFETMMAERTGISTQERINALLEKREGLYNSINETIALSTALAREQMGIFEGSVRRATTGSTPSGSTPAGGGATSAPTSPGVAYGGGWALRMLEDAGTIGKAELDRLTHDAAVEAARAFGEWWSLRTQTLTADLRAFEDAGGVGRTEQERLVREAAEAADRAIGEWFSQRLSLTGGLRALEDSGSIGAAALEASLAEAREAAARKLADGIARMSRDLRLDEDAGTMGMAAFNEAAAAADRAIGEFMASRLALTADLRALEDAGSAGKSQVEATLAAAREQAEQDIADWFAYRMAFMGRSLRADEDAGMMGMGAFNAIPARPGGIRVNEIDEAEAERIASNRARLEQEAADRFAQTVVSAGFRFGESAIQAFKDGDITGVIKAGLGGAQSVLGGIQGGPTLGLLGGSIPIFGLIAGALGVLGSLLGGGRGSEAQRREQAARERQRSVPAVNITFSMTQTNHITSQSTEAGTAAMLRGVVSGALDEFLARTQLVERIQRLEGAAAV